MKLKASEEGIVGYIRRTPRGVRGLKSPCQATPSQSQIPSHPSRGAWIEITVWSITLMRRTKSHPSRGAWIEILGMGSSITLQPSHPSRGAWIEIILLPRLLRLHKVAPLAGCVD